MQQELFNQSYKIQIIPLAIYGVGVDTHAHIYTQPQILARMKISLNKY